MPVSNFLSQRFGFGNTQQFPQAEIECDNTLNNGFQFSSQ